MSAESWPPQLKYDRQKSMSMLSSPSCRDWVAQCLGQMTDLNREEAQAELKQVIADSFAAKTLWTTDWKGVQLKRYDSFAAGLATAYG